MRIHAFVAVACAAGSAHAAPAATAAPTPDKIIQKVLESDPWGLSGAEVSAHAVLRDKDGASSELTFTARSRMYAAPLAKSLVRFSAPADLAGAGFLQVQKTEGDDERYLFMPELKRSRRIAGSVRSNAFMGTDFTFADLDRRDLRDGAATAKPDEVFEKIACYRVDVQPKEGSQYTRIELWVEKDNFLPLKIEMYDKANVHVKTLTAKETRRVSSHWFISKSTMVNLREKHTTELVLDKIAPRDDLADGEFTVANLEKL
jgi:hypothetical protein